MAKISDVYKGGNFLTTEDLGGKLLEDTIESVEVRPIGDTDKIVVTFVNHDKIWPCNVTNAKSLAALYGSDDTDDWAGHPIILRPDSTNFGGKMTPCIRVDSVAMGAVLGSEIFNNDEAALAAA